MRIRSFVLTMVACLSFGSMAYADMHIANRNSGIHTLSGGLVGNGGGTVVCRDPKDQHILSVELLDFYEARTIRHLTLDIQNIPGDWRQKVQVIVAGIADKSNFRYQLYTMWAKTFEAESNQLQGVQFSNVPDSGYIGVPTGCEFEQAAIQRQPMFSGDARYYINADLWNAMDDNQKAGLVLHEIIYREAIGYGHTDSIRSRYLTGLYTTEDFKVMSLEDYWKALNQAHFELADVKSPKSFGDIKSVVQLARLWRASPDETKVPSIELPNRFLMSVGDCQGEGCSEFLSHVNLIPSDDSCFQVTLGADLESLEIGNTTLDNFRRAPKSELSLSVDYINAEPRVTLRSMAGVRFFATQNIGQNQKMASGVAYLILDKSSQSWDWNGLSIDGIGLMSTTLSGSHHGIDNFIADSQGCQKIYLTFAGDNVSSVKVSDSLEEGCDSTDSSADIYNHLANGILVLASNDATSIYLYDSNHPGRLLEAGQTYNEWIPADQSVRPLECVGYVADGNINGCLEPKFDSSGAVQQLTIVNRAASFKFFSKNMELSQAFAKVGSTIEFYPNGAPKSLINDRPVFIDIDGKQTLVSGGATLEFSDQGTLTEIH